VDDREAEVRRVYAETAAILLTFPPPDEIPEGWEPPLPLDPEHLGTCWVTASYLAHRLHGEVLGYVHAMNPSALIGMLTFGHDFAFIDNRWILDWWATEYMSDTFGRHPGILDLHNPQQAAAAFLWYGDRRRWELSEEK
jgi:hypothetical protein